MARFLKCKGVKEGDLIGIYFRRSELPIVGILAILKSGAAYVPIDRSFPEERIRHIIGDAEIKILLSETELLGEITPFFENAAFVIDVKAPEITRQTTNRFAKGEICIKPGNLCYIIYTSGSTGRPKGVMTEHRNVVHFINAFKQVCRLNSSDRVYNSFAYSFDGSVEEIWMAFSNGASLVVAPDEVTRLGSEAAKLINQENITFFSTVPTFLSMINEDLPSVRLLVVSGEACPTELVSKWAVNKRRMLNVYGPTEITVNATSWECISGKKVTIGKAIPGYSLHILDDNLKPVSDGEHGELFIGGDGLARGYLNQPRLTSKTFVSGILNESRLFKTGDLVKLDANGELIFLGRKDSQVKIRGYRIELSEIEAVLRKHPNVYASAVKVVEKKGMKKLAAYIVLKDKNLPIENDAILDLLQQRLPVYMIPSYLEVIDEVPLLTSGKIDKKRLPEASTPLIRKKRIIIEPVTKLEHTIAGVWKEVFGMDTVSITDDFFLELGGHSLLAAEVVSILRNKFSIEVAIRDVYHYPTIGKLANHVNGLLTKKLTKAESVDPKDTGDRTTKKLPKWQEVLIKGIQFFSMYLLYGIGTLPFVFLVGYYFWAEKAGYSLTEIILTGLAITLLLIYPLLLGMSIAAKWVIIGKYKPGEYPVNGFYYFRWWLVDRIQALSGDNLLAGTPLMSLYYRLMGAKVGKNCIIDTHLCSAYDLVSIGKNTTICNATQLQGCRVEDGLLKIGRIDIGNNCFIGIHSYIGMDTKMEDNSRLGDLSLLADGERIAANESKQGSPPVSEKVNIPEGKIYKRRPFLFGFLHLLSIYGIFFFLYLTSLPVFALLGFAYLSGNTVLMVLSLLISGPLGIVSFCLFTAGIKKIILKKVKPGTYPVESLFYLRKWFIDSLIRLSVALARPLYTTIYLPTWLRMLGAKVGKRAEISTVSQISPELMDIGDESFFADGSIIGGRHFYSGYIGLTKSKIGKRSFIGNSAILPIGTSVGDHCLIGVLSKPPISKGTVEDGTEWLGSPSFRLPYRKKVEGFDEKVIYKPTPKLYFQRCLIDGLRIFIPSAIEVYSLLAFLISALLLYNNFGFWKMLAALPLVSLVIAVIDALLVVLVKWILMGRIKPVIKPLWSKFVWYNEAVNGAYESVTASVLSPMLGTPFFAPFLRMMGCKIGKNVYMGTTLFSEFDLVNIGDNVSLNAGVVIQNHLFEDRIMKASSLYIKENCNVGNMSVVLYDTEMNSHSTLDSLSLLMKGEILPDNSNWHGIPCQKD